MSAAVRERRVQLQPDPRTPGRLMAAVWCVCGRFWTLAARAPESAAHCPQCGRP